MENAITYVRRLRQEASYENFWPPITLGFGEHPGETTAITFTADRLTLCRLGKHCTCRELLREAQLRLKM
jgi:hypothetical protein